MQRRSGQVRSGQVRSGQVRSGQRQFARGIEHKSNVQKRPGTRAGFFHPHPLSIKQQMGNWRKAGAKCSDRRDRPLYLTQSRLSGLIIAALGAYNRGSGLTSASTSCSTRTTAKSKTASEYVLKTRSWSPVALLL